MRSRSRIPDELRRRLVTGGVVVLVVFTGMVAVMLGAPPPDAAVPGSATVAFAGRASSTGQTPGTVPALPESASATAVANSAAGLDAEARAARKAARKADEPAPDPDPETDPVVTPPVPAAPGAPAGVSAVAGNGVDVVSWTPSPGPGLTYVITQAVSADGEAIEVARVDATVVSATISVGEPGIRYYYVRAVDGIGQISDPAGPVSNDQVAMSGEVTPSGATLSSSNGDVILELPAGAYATTTTISVTERTDVDGPGGGILSLAGIYDIQPSGSLGAPATLRIRYQLSIQYFSIAQRLLEATELLTQEGSGAWVPAATDVHVDGGYVVGGLTHFSPWTPGTIQPHGTSPATTNYCDGVCHNGSAMPGSLIGYPIRDKSVCYLCHGSDAPGQPAREPSQANIQAELKDFVGQTFDPATESRHPIGEGDLLCTTCHDPHANPTLGYAGILRVKDPFGRVVRSTATAPAGEAFCWACHGIRENRAISALVPGYYLRTGGNKQTGYAGNAHSGNAAITTGAGSCTGCHTGHGAQSPSLLAASEEETCFACHTTSPTLPTDPAPDVIAPIQRDAGDGQAGHPIGDPLRVGRHSTDETAAAHGWANRHVECGDCHDAHTAKQGAHVLGTNEAAPALDGVWGVQVTNGAAGTTPAYTRTEDVTYEYELCFKCHSAYVPGYTDLIGGVRAEDMSVTFNPANASAHPIEGPGKNLGIKDSAFTLGTPWNPTDGDDPDYGEDVANLDSIPKMTCSDCHSSNDLSEARGPHGSTFDNILERIATDKLLGPYSATYYGENDLCYKCHAASVYDRNASAEGRASSRLSHGHFTWKTHCLACHDPHGSPEEHMLYPKVSLSHTAIGGRLDGQYIKVLNGVGCNWTGCHPGWVEYTSNY